MSHKGAQRGACTFDSIVTMDYFVKSYGAHLKLFHIYYPAFEMRNNPALNVSCSYE